MNELQTLRHDPENPHARSLFGDMTAAALAQAINRVLAIPPAQIRQVIAEQGGSPALAEKMLARQQDMARRLDQLVTSS